MILLSMLLVAAGPADRALESYHDRTRAVVTCHATTDSDDVVVCGRREADRYRAPLIVHDPGDRRYVGVPEERSRLIRRTTPIEDHGPFLVGGGMAGVTMTAGADGAQVGGVRPIAP